MACCEVILIVTDKSGWRRFLFINRNILFVLVPVGSKDIVTEVEQAEDR